MIPREFDGRLAGIFDRDGTLAPLKGAASDEIRDALEYLVAAGRGVGLVSVRGEIRLGQTITGDHLPITLPIAFEAGGAVRDTDDSLITFPISTQQKQEIAKALLERQGEVKLAAFYPKNDSSGKRAKIFVDSQEAKERLVTNTVFQEIAGTDDIFTDMNEFVALLAKPEMETCMIEIQPQDKQNFVPNMHSFTADGATLITAANVTKGTTVQEICRLKGIPLNNLIVAGDQDVDQSLLNIPGAISIAVGNPVLHAKYHVDTPDELAALIVALQNARYTMSAPNS